MMSFRSHILSLGLLAAFGVTACTGDDDGSSEPTMPGACTALENLRFQSEQLQTDCGPPGPEPETCYWGVEFLPADDETTEYHYYSQDNGESGFVVCDREHVLEASTSVELGSYSAATRKLVWHTIVYVVLE